MDETIHSSGGFFPPSLPSPSPSHVSTSSATSILPHPRAHPLRPGSAKEDATRRYVDSRLLQISRRYAKKFQPKENSMESDVKGYESMGEVAKDVGEIVDVVWLSGTRKQRTLMIPWISLIAAQASLQIPYLLSIAGSVNSYLPAFPPSPRGTFALLRKLDHAFSSLMQGEDSITGEVLPGFQGDQRAGLSKTDMVRCKGLVEATRVIMVGLMDRELEVDIDESDSNSVLEMESPENLGDGMYEMDVARIYEETIMKLGERLESNGSFQATPTEST
jgi:hypothetical protein